MHILVGSLNGVKSGAYGSIGKIGISDSGHPLSKKTGIIVQTSLKFCAV